MRFSDEYLIQIGSNPNREWAFRYPNEKWKYNIVEEYTTARLPAQMVWGLIWIDRWQRVYRSPLVIMQRDPSARNNGYSA